MLNEYGPERLRGQGLDPNQHQSGDRTIAALLTRPPACDQIDLVATWRGGAYEVWARRGMIRFKRFADEAGNLHFEVIEQIGENPIGNQDPFAVSTIEEEIRAAHASGNPCDDPNAAFFEPHALSHPFAYERIAQVFDSPRGPDLIVSPKAYAYGIQPGQHGALDVVQSRAPLIFSGPGVSPGRHAIAARHVDIAPTVAHLMGFPADHARGAAVYLKRQDGRVLDAIGGGSAGRPERVYMILLDGLSHTELVHHLERMPDAIPHIAALARAGAMLAHGSIVNFPSITWPSHSTIMTGTWCGHHDIVNPTYHDRERRESVPVQGLIFDTERYLNPEVETLYEAFKRVYGPDTLTASIHEPQGRGADHNVFERRFVGDKVRLKEITIGLMDTVSPRWMADDKPAMHREEVVDVRGMAQLTSLFEHCGERFPRFVAHEFVLTDGAGHDYGPHHDGLREALYRTDQRIGEVLAMMRRHRLLDSTLFVVTSDHGMAAQRIELAANPAAEPAKAGIKGVFVEPMIYLRDLAVEANRARDGRTIRVRVIDNDMDAMGEYPPVEGARVALRDRAGRLLGESSTSMTGVAAFSTPATVRDDDLVIAIEHPEFNPRQLRASGEAVAEDLREMLYGHR